MGPRHLAAWCGACLLLQQLRSGGVADARVVQEVPFEEYFMNYKQVSVYPTSMCRQNTVCR